MEPKVGLLVVYVASLSLCAEPAEDQNSNQADTIVYIAIVTATE